MSKFALIFAALAVATAVAYPTQPTNPIIAIVTSPDVDCFAFTTPPPGVNSAGGCMDSFYPSWLQSAGIRVVPLVWNASWESRQNLLDSVNGVLFPGGGLDDPWFSWYVGNATQIFDYAVQRNEAGDPFFLWGTCQGFQVLTVIAARTQSILKCVYSGTDPSMLPLDFTSYQPTSQMFGPAAESPLNIVNILKTENSTLNWHHCGINPADLTPSFNDVFHVVSTNTDLNNLAFISSIESSKYNFFATQFHPERVPYEFTSDVIGHTPNDIAVSTYLANFIAKRLQMNNHTYATPQDANAATVQNYPRANLGWGYGVYWFSNPAN